MTARILPLLAGLGVLILGFMELRADAPLSAEQALRALHGLLGASAWAMAAVGLGGALLGACSLAAALALGLGVLGLALLPLGALGLLSTPTFVVVLLAAGSGWLLRPQVRLPELGLGAVTFGGMLLAPLLIQALAPPTDTDEIYQHLALPAQMLRTGGLVSGLLHPDGSRPMGLHLVYTGVLALGGEPGPKLLHLGIALLCVLQTRALGARLLGERAGDVAALLLLGSYSVARELALAHNNLPIALLMVLALEAALEGQLRRLAAFCGLALAYKYLAAPAVLGVMLVAWQREGLRGTGRVVACGVAALAWVAPWWLRNALEGLHPLFPYMGWPEAERFTFAYVERYGVGRSPLDLLLLPWNMTVLAHTDTYQFLGRVSPAGLALLPAAALALWHSPEGRAPISRTLALAGGVAFLGWAAGPHWLRYLLPASPLVALALSAGVPLLPRWGLGLIFALWVSGLPANWGPVAQDLAGEAPVVLGRAPREDLLRQRVQGWDAVDWVNRYSPPDARVALLFAWPGYYLERPYLLGSVEDHVPSRHLLLVNGDGALPLLQQLGVTHVLAAKVRFIRKSYSFLDDATFREQFTEPGAALEQQLLKQGVLVYEQGLYGVWRLEAR